jgi:FtsZ-interacting cell division protein ZipA
MDMDQAAVFLAGSILMSMGVLVIVGAVVIINNIIHAYWKSFGWSIFPFDHRPPIFMDPSEMKKEEPVLEKK